MNLKFLGFLLLYIASSIVFFYLLSCIFNFILSIKGKNPLIFSKHFSLKIFDGLKKIKRKKEFTKQFPHTLNQIANIVRTGSSIEEALSTIARENPPPVGEEFELLMTEYKIYRDLSLGLKNLCGRIQSDELKIFANSIIISKRTGANLIEQLENIRKTITDRLYIEGKIRALTAQSKIQGICSSIIPLGIILFASWIDPEYFRPLINTTLGNIIICLAFFMNVLGLFFISKLSKIKI